MDQYSALNKNIPKVIFIGKPNVGKSTLFNTIIGRKEAIVGEEVGLTRDFQDIRHFIGNIQVFLSDTAGISIKDNKKLTQMSRVNTLKKIELSDLIFFLIDGSNELTNEDHACANYLRKFKKKVILLSNKAELKQSKNYKDQGYTLGFDKPIEITGKSKSTQLIINNIITNFLAKKSFKTKLVSNLNKDRVSLSISGKPNTGKSTIFNNIFGSERVLVSSEAGTTRDSIKEQIVYDNLLFDMVDTAGIKKKIKSI